MYSRGEAIAMPGGSKNEKLEHRIKSLENEMAAHQRIVESLRKSEITHKSLLNLIPSPSS
jgi:hypothetical protein